MVSWNRKITLGKNWENKSTMCTLVNSNVSVFVH